MNAIVSGRSGRALIIEGDSLKSFDVNDPSRIVPRQRAELPYLFGEATDLRILENTSLESVERELEKDRNFTQALDLTLISLDVELPTDIRKEAIIALEELLAANKTLEHVESVLYAAELPKTADLKGALELCTRTTRLSHGFLQTLGKSQPQIAAVCRAWELISTERFGGSKYRDEFKRVAVREGLFRALVIGRPLVDSVSRRLALSPSIQNLLNHEQILREWQKSARLAIVRLGHVSYRVEPLSTLDKTSIKERIKALKYARTIRMKAEKRRKHKSNLRKQIGPIKST